MEPRRSALTATDTSTQQGRILVVDRFTPPGFFPDDQGVGLARKIGVDLCARLHASGRLASSFVHTTDADVELPNDYFDRTPAGPAAALLFPFFHRPDVEPRLGRAVLLYEISLRYYVLGLSFAGSPYAFHTIGSTIATDVGAYMKVRGFPKRDRLFLKYDSAVELLVFPVCDGQVAHAHQRRAMLGAELGFLERERFFEQRQSTVELPQGLVSRRKVVHAHENVGVTRFELHLSDPQDLFE